MIEQDTNGTSAANRRGASSGKSQISTGLAIQAIRSVAELEALSSEWLALGERLQSELPFSDARWMAAWWKNLRRHDRLTRDSLFVLAFRRDGRLIAVAPYMLTTRRVFGVPVLRILQPIGTDPNITEVRCMLVSSEDEHAVTTALVGFARKFVRCDAIVVTGLSAAGEAAESLARTDDVAETTPLSMFVLNLAPTWDELRSALPRNMREALRKCRNSLARDAHVPTFRVLEDEKSIIDALPRFLELHRSRADAVDTVNHGDVFSRDSARAFLPDVVRRFSASGRILLFTMEIDGTVVAARFAFRCHDCLYLYYSGYDMAWSKYSVMTSVTAEAIQYAIASGLRRVNLSTGSDQSKLRWRPEEIRTRSFAVQKQTIRVRMAHGFVAAGRSIRARWEKRRDPSGP